MTARVSAVVGALVIAWTSALVVSMPAVAQQAASKDRTVNPKMGPPLQAATAAAKNKQYDVAMAKLKEAEAEKKTAFEQFKIYETSAFILYGQKKYAETAGAYEKMLETPQFLTPEQVQSYPKTIAQMYAAANQNQKVIDYGKKWLTEKPNDTEMLAAVGQAYYNTKDNKNCLQSFQSAVANAEKAGAKPQEPWLQFTQACASEIGDKNAETQAYEKLIRYYPKPQYWQRYLREVSGNEKSDVATFQWMRLMSDTDSFKSDEDYMNFAQPAIADFGASCEAVRSLEEGFSKKVLGVNEKAKARHQNTLARAKEVAASDKARVQQLLGEAEADTTGQKYVDAGKIQAACQQNDQAITNLEKGIKKGGGKDLATAKLTLGIAQLKKGEREAARNTFKALHNDKVLGKVADTWMIRSYN